MNTTSALKAFVVGPAICAASVLCAQSDRSSALSAADQAWDAMRATPRTEATGSRSRQHMVDDFKRAADGAKAFREKYPDDPKAAEAKLIELHELLDSSLAGDDSQENRIAALLADVRREPRLLADAKIKAMAHAEAARLQPLTADLEKWRAAQQESARRLIAGFPGEAGGYEALLHAAENEPDDAKAAALAREVEGLPASAPVKAAARLLLDRQALVGRSLWETAQAALAAEPMLKAAKGKAFVVYTWATWSPGAIAHAKRLSEVLPAGVVLIGLNLDQEVAAARTQAERERLPGDQIYDEQGLAGRLAQALKATAAMPAYVVGPQGGIRAVFPLRDDLPGKLTRAVR